MEPRLIIYPKDIERITGKAYRASHKLLQRIRKHFNKESHHLVTVEDFCSYTGISRAEVQRLLR